MHNSRKTMLSIIRRISPKDFSHSRLTKDELIEIASLCEAFWIHSGDARAPHAELSSGLCSNGYLNFMYLLRYPNISQILAHEVLKNLPTSIYIDTIDWVVGSALTATGLAKDAANILNAQWAPLEKNAEGEQVWGRLSFQPGETVLQVEDMVTSGKSAFSVRDAFLQAHTDTEVRILPCILSVASRPTYDRGVDTKISVREVQFYPVYTFDNFWICTQEKCQLCTNGSKRLRPKERDNWAALTTQSKKEWSCIGR